MKSFIMNTMKSGADECLQLSLSDAAHCINPLSVAHTFASLYPFEMKCPMKTVCHKPDNFATFQKRKKKKNKKERVDSHLP